MKRTKKSKTPNFNISTVVTQALLSLNTCEYNDVRDPQFRVSSFPFCPILFGLSTREQTNRYTSTFYTSAGTAIHNTIQQYLGLSKEYKVRFLGNWVHRDGTRKELCVRPKSKGGKHLWNYEEITIDYKNLSGHVDTIIEIKDAKDRKYHIVLDYKTTTLSYYGGSKNTSKYPIPGNVVQISSYCSLLKRTYKLNIIGWCLAYVDRSRPIRSVRDFHLVSRNWTEEEDAKWIKRIDRASASADSAKVMYDSKYIIVERKALKAAVKQAVQLRPCTNAADFADVMYPAFYYEHSSGGAGKDKNVCKYLSRCSSCKGLVGEKKLQAFFLKELDKQV